MLAAGLALFSTQAGAAKPTFVEADLHLGMSTSPYEDGSVAPAWGAMIGVGGKLKSFPPRFYLMAGVLHQPFHSQGTYSMTQEWYRMRQDMLDISLGLRIVIPIYRGLRMYLDLMGLASWHRTDLLRGDTIDRQSSVWVGGGIAAMGLQYRWHRLASTGLRLEWTVYGKLGSTLPAAVGMDVRQNGKLVLAVVQSWYF